MGVVFDVEFDGDEGALIRVNGEVVGSFISKDHARKFSKAIDEYGDAMWLDGHRGILRRTGETNYDRHLGTPEKAAEFLSHGYECYKCPLMLKCEALDDLDCRPTIVKWLESEAE